MLIAVRCAVVVLYYTLVGNFTVVCFGFNIVVGLMYCT